MDSIDSAISSVMQAKSAATQQQIVYAVLAKSQAAAKSQGAAVAQMLDACANIGKAVGKGQQLDAVG